MKMLRTVLARWALLTTLLFGVGFGLGLSLQSRAVAGDGTPKWVAPRPANASHPSVAPGAQESGTSLSTPDIVDRVIPAVVTIYSTRAGHPNNHPRFQTPPDAPEFSPRGREQGLGSGILVDSRGVILTNNHVIEGATELRVVLADRREYVPRVVGSDKKTDLAVLRIDAPGLPALPFGDSAKARVGESVLAVGNPLGVGETVSKGIVSAKGRGHVGVADYEDFLQTDAAINPGNSGGALVNMKGELIGINTAIASPTGSFNGIGFAIPSNMARQVMQIILKEGKVTRGQIGISVQDMTPELAKAIEGAPDQGVLISQVLPGSPADRAGLKAGDIITKEGAEDVRTASDLRNRVSLHGAGARVSLFLWRDQKTLTMTLNLQKETEAGSTPSEERDATPETDEGSACGLRGIRVRPAAPEALEQMGLPGGLSGLFVTSIDSSKASVFLGLQKGDLVTEVNRTPVGSLEQMRRAIQKGKASVLLSVRRGDRTIYVAVPRE